MGWAVESPGVMNAKAEWRHKGLCESLEGWRGGGAAMVELELTGAGEGWECWVKGERDGAHWGRVGRG